MGSPTGAATTVRVRRTLHAFDSYAVAVLLALYRRCGDVEASFELTAETFARLVTRDGGENIRPARVCAEYQGALADALEHGAPPSDARAELGLSGFTLLDCQRQSLTHLCDDLLGRDAPLPATRPNTVADTFADLVDLPYAGSPLVHSSLYALRAEIAALR